MKPVAFVIPWFGRDLKGGAVQQAWQVTTRLAARGYKIEVLTTCCRSFLDDWATNRYKAGLYNEEEVIIRRFSVNKRNHIAFNNLNGRMLNIDRHHLKPGISPVTPDESAIFAKKTINSDNLLNYLKSHKKRYHAFIFLPYLFGPSINGLPLVCEKAIRVVNEDVLTGVEKSEEDRTRARERLSKFSQRLHDLSHYKK